MVCLVRKNATRPVTRAGWSKGQTIALTIAMAAICASITAIVLDRAGESTIVVQDSADTPVVVYIDGAVATPGLVTLPPDARLASAIDAAGGSLPDARFDDLNLAARLTDGEHITIPSVSPTAAAPGVAESVATPSDGRININSATSTELESLPEIGPVLASRIVAYREENGPFDSVDQLDEIEGISPSLVETLRPLITVDD